MDEEIKRTHNSLPEEEKEQLQKYQKKYYLIKINKKRKQLAKNRQ